MWAVRAVWAASKVPVKSSLSRLAYSRILPSCSTWLLYSVVADAANNIPQAPVFGRSAHGEPQADDIPSPPLPLRFQIHSPATPHRLSTQHVRVRDTCVPCPPLALPRRRPPKDGPLPSSQVQSSPVQPRPVAHNLTSANLALRLTGTPLPDPAIAPTFSAVSRPAFSATLPALRSVRVRCIARPHGTLRPGRSRTSYSFFSFSSASSPPSLVVQTPPLSLRTAPTYPQHQHRLLTSTWISSRHGCAPPSLPMMLPFSPPSCSPSC